MSAYGPIGSASRTATPLPTTRWRLNPTSKFTPAPNSYLTIHHVTLATASAIPGLVEYLHKTFADELERGLTYPQEILPGETYTLEAFQAYYFAADVLVAVVGGSADREVVDGEEVELSLSKAIDGKTLEESVAGCYYVKPNYPGRSSHVCSSCPVRSSLQCSLLRRSATPVSLFLMPSADEESALSLPGPTCTTDLG